MSKNDKFTRESDKRFTLRIDKNLFQKIKILAEKDKRSIGREIEFILDQWISEHTREE